MKVNMSMIVFASALATTGYGVYKLLIYNIWGVGYFIIGALFILSSMVIKRGEKKKSVLEAYLEEGEVEENEDSARNW